MKKLAGFCVTDLEHLEWSDLFYDGHGHVRFRDGSRLNLVSNAVFYNTKGSLDSE
jgi:hypothetical protein